jgi:hypothetical protein
MINCWAVAATEITQPFILFLSIKFDFILDNVSYLIDILSVAGRLAKADVWNKSCCIDIFFGRYLSFL